MSMFSPITRFFSGSLLLGGLGLLLTGQPVRADVISVVATNEVLCGPSNTTAMVRPIKPQPASTLRMIERINKIRASTDPATQPFMNPERAQMIQKQLSSETDARRRVTLGFQLAIELLNCGRPEAALQQIRASELIITNNALRLDHKLQSELRMFKATAMLRLGEQENCVANHNAESCVFPLSPAAVHKRQRGSRGAITLITEQLKDSPQDLSARWLLNLAYMTLGEYPERVPGEWLIPPKIFQSDCAFPRFPDVAGALGVDVIGAAGGVVSRCGWRAGGGCDRRGRGSCSG
jgi:hypothetical protein